jgi:hypothetical protein
MITNLFKGLTGFPGVLVDRSRVTHATHGILPYILALRLALRSIVSTCMCRFCRVTHNLVGWHGPCIMQALCQVLGGMVLACSSIVPSRHEHITKQRYPPGSARGHMAISTERYPPGSARGHMAISTEIEKPPGPLPIRVQERGWIRTEQRLVPPPVLRSPSYDLRSRFLETQSCPVTCHT